MNGLPYYKAYPRDFIEGTIGMDFELKGAYRLVLDLIYMQGGNLPDDARYISGLLGCAVRKWKTIREELIARGKLVVVGDCLTNKRADNELEILRKFQEKQRENRARSNKNKDLQKPRSDHTEPEAEATSVANAREASPPISQQDPTARERLLAAIGADPVSGMIGPNGTRLGTMGDMAEAKKWADAGLSLDDQCRLLSERMASMLARNPGFIPRSFGYFSGAMSDFAARKSSPLPSSQATKPDEKASKLARWDRIAKGAA